MLAVADELISIVEACAAPAEGVWSDKASGIVQLNGHSVGF
jgi:hypothetical protein